MNVDDISAVSKLTIHRKEEAYEVDQPFSTHYVFHDLSNFLFGFRPWRFKGS